MSILDLCVSVWMLSCMCCLCCVPLIPRSPGLQGNSWRGAAVACQPWAPAAPLPFTAPHMVLQRWFPRGLLAPHHPGPGHATRPLSPPVSPQHRGSPSPLSPLYPLSFYPTPLFFWLSGSCLDLSSSFCCLLLTHTFPSPSSLPLPFNWCFFSSLASSVSYFSWTFPPIHCSEVNTGIYSSH